MSEQQNSKLAASLVEHQKNFDCMSTEDRQWAIQNTVEAIKLFAEAARNRGSKVVAKLLSFVTTLTVGGAKKFSAKKKFVVDTSDDAEVKIYDLGSNFMRIFGDLIEEDVEGVTLNVHNLNQASLDPDIMVELGAERRVIKLANFYEALRQQGHGQAGKLLTKGYAANIAYIIGNDDNVWAVDARWRDDGWDVDANSVGDPFWWDAGRQVLSRGF